MTTVRDATFTLLRNLNIKTIFGNPGSTEETFLQDLPDDFHYVQVLQEGSAIAAADVYAQATGTVGLVNVHTAAGVSNAMSHILSARTNKTPVIITAGNQTRDMLLMEPWLTNTSPIELPKPFVKWSYEPVRAEDVPAALMRAYAMALQEPAGPVFLSIPLDDWNQPYNGDLVTRSVANKVAADPARLKQFADKLSAAKNPVLIYGADITKHHGWDDAIAFAEKLNAPVWAAPASERTPFPEDHPLYAGGLPFAIQPLEEKLRGHDVALVIGAPVFRYYPYVPGRYLPEGLELLHISNDPEEAARAPVGDSLISNPVLALQALLGLIQPSARKPNSINKLPHNMAPHAAAAQPNDDKALSAFTVFSTVRKAMPADAILVCETPSNLAELHTAWPITFPDGYYTASSGSLGWGLPAAVGVALAERDNKTNRVVVAPIGDGSLQYSVQGLWTAAQQQLNILYIVPLNEEYGILKSFSECQNTPNVPGLNIPNLNIPALAEGYGCVGVRAETEAEITAACQAALKRQGPTVIGVPITKAIPKLY